MVLPKGSNLLNTELALHEYLGILAISAGQGRTAYTARNLSFRGSNAT
jgi:hypothetical protein